METLDAERNRAAMKVYVLLNNGLQDVDILENCTEWIIDNSGALLVKAQESETVRFEITYNRRYWVMVKELK